jgi:hypothetical protein
VEGVVSDCDSYSDGLVGGSAPAGRYGKLVSRQRRRCLVPMERFYMAVTGIGVNQIMIG